MSYMYDVKISHLHSRGRRVNRSVSSWSKVLTFSSLFLAKSHFCDTDFCRNVKLTRLRKMAVFLTLLLYFIHKKTLNSYVPAKLISNR